MPRMVMVAVLAALVVSAKSGCAESPAIVPVKIDKAELQVIDHVAVLSLAGSPQDMGDDEAQIVGDKAATLLGFGPALVKRIAGNVAWQAHVIVSRTLLANVAPRHREEIEAFQKASGLPGNDLIASQMLYDTISSFGCSSILVPADQSAAGGPLMGRNFDYASFGLLHANDLVKVYRPDGQYAFAGVGFPGCFGVISGMNEHGLAIALHEVRRSADNSPKFNPAGVPTLFALRQVLEECRTIDEAKELLAKLPRTTMYNLAMCDPHNGGVLEVTVENVILRRTAGLNACTNHFRTKKLSLTKECDRFATLMQPSAEPFTVDTVFSRLQATNQGEKTFQSMVFEPSDLVLHLAIETRPSTDGTLRRIDLKPLLQPK